MSEDRHYVLHIYEGDSAFVVRDNGNKSLYGVKLPELLALFDEHSPAATQEADGLMERLAAVERERDALVLSTGEHITLRSEYLARAEAAEAKVLALTTALTEAVTKVENDRTLWNAEWQQWLLDARAALSPDKGAGE